MARAASPQHYKPHNFPGSRRCDKRLSGDIAFTQINFVLLMQNSLLLYECISGANSRPFPGVLQHGRGPALPGQGDEADAASQVGNTCYLQLQSVLQQPHATEDQHTC